MKLPLLLAAVCSLVCSSCQNVHWPWKKADAVADPYAAAAGQYNTYPQQPNYTQPPAQDLNAPNYNNTYNTGGIARPSWSADGRTLMVLGYTRLPDGGRTARHRHEGPLPD